jgi:hypothetical protein
VEDGSDQSDDASLSSSVGPGGGSVRALSKQLADSAAAGRARERAHHRACWVGQPRPNRAPSPTVAPKPTVTLDAAAHLPTSVGLRHDRPRPRRPCVGRS